MALAMVLAAASFFLGQAKLFPEALGHNTALLVVLHAGCWLWRTLRLKPLPPTR